MSSTEGFCSHAMFKNANNCFNQQFKQTIAIDFEFCKPLRCGGFVEATGHSAAFTSILKLCNCKTLQLHLFSLASASTRSLCGSALFFFQCFFLFFSESSNNRLLSWSEDSTGCLVSGIPGSCHGDQTRANHPHQFEIGLLFLSSLLSFGFCIFLHGQ